MNSQKDGGCQGFLVLIFSLLILFFHANPKLSAGLHLSIIDSYLRSMKKANPKIENHFILAIEKRFLNEMPRILKEIEVYEMHLKQGKLNKSPSIAPQFVH